MRRIPHVATIVLLLIANHVLAQEIKPSGDYVIVFKTLPFELIADEGANFYFWTLPEALTASKTTNVTTVTAAPEGTYTAQVTTLTIDWSSQETLQSDSSITFAVGKTTPVIPPDDDPVDDESKYKFVSLSQTAAQRMTDGAQYKAAVADNFESIAAAIAAGSIKSVNDSQQQLSVKNRATIQGSTAIGEWTVFFQKWQDHAVAANNKTGDQQLRNVPADYAIAYRETAAGLRK